MNKIVHGTFNLLNAHYYIAQHSASLDRSEVAGFSLRLSWADLAPTATTYDFQRLKDSITLAKDHGKVIGLGVCAGTGCPAWLEALGARFVTITVKGVQKRMPWPWDPVFLAEWTKFIRALAAEFESEPTLVYLTMSGYGNNYGCDVVSSGDIPAFLAAGGIPAWDAAARTIVRAWTSAFPTTNCIMQVNSIIPTPEGSAELTVITDWTAATYPRHGGFMWEAWKETTGVNSPAGIVARHSATNPGGLQQIDNAASGRFGDLAAGIANLVNLGPPWYLEVYQQDFTDANTSLWQQANGILRSSWGQSTPSTSYFSSIYAFFARFFNSIFGWRS